MLLAISEHNLDGPAISIIADYVRDGQLHIIGDQIFVRVFGSFIGFGMDVFERFVFRIVFYADES